MSWTADITIGELRPWPSVVLVKRGNTDDTKAYTPATTAKCSWQDETLHVELPELPKEMRVTLPDRCGGNRVRSARFWTYVPERTCKLIDNDSGPDMHCTACGGEVDDEYRWFMERWGYSRCPHCGAKIEVSA